jgi:HAD superfamily hydrolase (TIGR01509 family)
MTDSRPLRLLVFDNNGTALDDLHLAYASVGMIFQVIGLRGPTKDQFRNEIGAGYMEFYWRHGVPRRYTAEDLNPIRSLFYRHRIETAHYRDDLPPLLRACRKLGILTGMCSAEIPEVLQEYLTRAKLLESFSPGLICGGASPSKTPFLVSMAQQHGLAPTECAYVDDTEDGIRSAKEAGYYAIGFNNTTSHNSAERIYSAKPHLVVRTFNDLRHELPRLAMG